MASLPPKINLTHSHFKIEEQYLIHTNSLFLTKIILKEMYCCSGLLLWDLDLLYFLWDHTDDAMTLPLHIMLYMFDRLCKFQ